MISAMAKEAHEQIIGTADLLALELGSIKAVTVEKLRERARVKTTSAGEALDIWQGRQEAVMAAMPAVLLQSAHGWLRELWALAVIVGRQNDVVFSKRTEPPAVSQQTEVESVAKVPAASPKPRTSAAARPFKRKSTARVKTSAVPGRAGMPKGFLATREEGQTADKEAPESTSRPAIALENGCILNAAPAGASEATTPTEPADKSAETPSNIPAETDAAPFKRFKEMTEEEGHAFLDVLAENMEKVLSELKKPMPSSAIYRRIDERIRRAFPQADAHGILMMCQDRCKAATLVEGQWAILEVTDLSKPKSKGEIRNTPFAQDRREMTACVEKAIEILERSGRRMNVDALFELSGAQERQYGPRWFKWAMADRARRGPKNGPPRIRRAGKNKYEVRPAECVDVELNSCG